MIRVQVKKLNVQAKLPKYMSSGAAGCDLEACLAAPVTIPPKGRVAISTGLSVQIPEGYEIQVRPRSGLAFKQGLTVVNAPGTIDSDYRGEIKVLLINLGEESATIQSGDRIAQMVVQQVERADWQEVDVLEESVRGAGGFGSTGVSTH